MSKKKLARRALFTSVISLVLCCAMLMGTTFAWFTDSVSSAKNLIQAGNLDVELYYMNDETADWTVVDANTNVFKEATLWEPGHTEVVKLKVSNLGSLALKYQLGINIASETESINMAGDSFKVSDYIYFGVVEGDQTYTREEAVAAVEGTAKKLNAGYTEPSELKKQNDSEIVTVVVYMPTTVTNEANHGYNQTPPQINLGITLAATQLVNESDSFGPDYDELANLGPAWDGTSKEEPEADENGVIHITNAAELVAMMDVTGNSIYSGKTIVLDANINLGGRTVKGIGGGSNFAGVFDGQGYTIGNFKIDASDRDYYAGLFNQVSHGGTVKNLTVSNATVKGNSMVGAVASSVDSNATVDNCKAINCTLIGVKKVGAVVGYSAGSTVTNNYAENCTVYYSEKEGAEVLGFENTGSTVNNNTYSNVTVKHVAIVELEENVSTGDDFNAPNTIINLNGKTMTMTSSDQKVSGNLTVSGGAVDMSKGYFDLRPSADAEIVFENLVFDNTEKTKTFGSSTNHVKSAMETSPLVADATMKFTFKNCTFNNANVVFETMSSYPNLKIEATFENCTFNLFGNSSAIKIQNYITANITVKNSTFNLTATASAGIVDSMSGSTVNVTFEGSNILNGIAAVATDATVAGTVDEVKVHNPAVKVAATSWSIDSLTGADTITVQGIATK